MAIGSHSIKLYTGTASELSSRALLLAVGEMAQELDTGLIKAGDGTTPWAGLRATNQMLLDSAAFTGGSATQITTTGNTEFTALAMDIVVSSRPVAVTLKSVVQMFTAAAGVIIKVWDGAVGTTEVGRFQSATMAANGSSPIGGLSLLEAMSAGAHTLRFSGSLTTATSSPVGVFGVSNLKTEVTALEL